MAGVTDQPFRNLCRRFGSHWLVSEMVTSDTRLWHTAKSRHRLQFHDEQAPRWVQIAGADPTMMAEAAVMNVQLGAQIIDINMGCPAKKVCKKLAGSSLLRDEALVEAILSAVVRAVEVPVTLKMRLGWSRDEINATNIAQIAQRSGVQLITVHGRTREDRFRGTVDYAAVAAVKDAVTVPVVCNGDIESAQQAEDLLAQYGFDGVMIGRAAQGRPWLPALIDSQLQGGSAMAPSELEFIDILACHLRSLCEFYGEYTGVRVARKHVGWYLEGAAGSQSVLWEPGVERELTRSFNRLETLQAQLSFVENLALRIAA
jgi:tRNA-dihydrouridine synthase B